MLVRMLGIVQCVVALHDTSSVGVPVEKRQTRISSWLYFSLRSVKMKSFFFNTFVHRYTLNAILVLVAKTLRGAFRHRVGTAFIEFVTLGTIKLCVMFRMTFATSNLRSTS